MQAGGVGGIRSTGGGEAEAPPATALASPAEAQSTASTIVRGHAPTGRMAAQAAATTARGGAPATTAAAPAHASEDDHKLLTKKLAGERALATHLDGRVGPKYEAKVIPGADRDHYVVKLLRLSSSPPFVASSDPEAVYAVDRRTGAIARQGTPEAPAARGGAALGEQARPGKTLGGTTRTLGPEDAITLRTRENQIHGLGEIRVEPRGAVEVKRRMIEGAPPGRLGGTSLYEYELRLAPGTPPGTDVKVTTGGHFQTRNDPDWAFSFRIHAGKK